MDEVGNIVQEAVTKTIPKNKKCKKAKWLSEEALKIAEEIRDMKGKFSSVTYMYSAHKLNKQGDSIQP